MCLCDWSKGASQYRACIELHTQSSRKDAQSISGRAAYHKQSYATLSGNSCISCRVAQTQNVGQTALEAGNSPKIIFSNYRELVKPADALKWFGIEPEAPQNVIQAPIASAAVGQ
jgi:t-SNARE complex subunit (syntaxin)